MTCHLCHGNAEGTLSVDSKSCPACVDCAYAAFESGYLLGNRKVKFIPYQEVNVPVTSQ